MNQQATESLNQITKRLPANSHVLRLMYVTPDGVKHTETCWWLSDNPSHQADPAGFLTMNGRALVHGMACQAVKHG